VISIQYSVIRLRLFEEAAGEGVGPMGDDREGNKGCQRKVGQSQWGKMGARNERNVLHPAYKNFPHHQKDEPNDVYERHSIIVSE